MTEPIAAASVAATLSGVTMSVLGVPGHAVIWGFIGALATISQMERMPWYKAFMFGVLSTLMGAAFGTFGAEALDLKGKAALILGSLIGGAGAFAIIAAFVKRATRIAGGEK
jgi:hypothetical protein